MTPTSPTNGRQQLAEISEEVVSTGKQGRREAQR
jgi:hypothetical protein